MSYRLHPLWWPLLILFSPLIIPYLLLKNQSCRGKSEKNSGSRNSESGQEELSRTVSLLNEINPERVLLSPHDNSDFALGFLSSKLTAETNFLKSGDTFQL